MPFRFSHICTLLDSYEKIQCRDPPFLPAKRQDAVRLATHSWFRAHRLDLDSTGTDRAAFLSCLLFDRRTDRVYGIQATRLTKIIGRCFNLTSAKLANLKLWNLPGNGDLGACVERLLTPFDAEPKPGTTTAEEVDAVLHKLASRCRFSSPEVRTRPCAQFPEEILKPLFLKLRSSEAKWLTRLILKDLGPILINHQLILRHVHFLLPSLLQFQDNLFSSIKLLDGPLKCYPSRTDPQSEKLHAISAASYLVPKVGLKVGNPAFKKARSVKNCVSLAGKQRWSVERKYDGEYCEIHIDLTKSSERIKIFSKSGKDSTQDRKDIHETIVSCLQIGQGGCLFKSHCIVLAEMLPYSDTNEAILEFHKIRKLVTRSGSRLGVGQDSQKHDDEHLMLAFFDVLLLDDDNMMVKALKERKQCLRRMVRVERGRAIIAESQIIDFRSTDAICRLKSMFLSSIKECYEGLVLKPCGVPYVDFGSSITGRSENKFIKFKKDFIPGLGDTVDFAIVGGSYNVKKSHKYRKACLEFTSFYLACQEDGNVNDDIKYKKPKFKVVGMIEESACIPAPCLAILNDTGRFIAQGYEEGSMPLNFELTFTKPELKSIKKVFTEPIVCEVLGSGFEKPSGVNTYMLRHPRILKVHSDRTWNDVISFAELQNLGEASQKEPAKEDMEEMEKLLDHSIENTAHSREVGDTQQTPSPKSAGNTSQEVEPVKICQMIASTPEVLRAKGICHEKAINSFSQDSLPFTSFTSTKGCSAQEEKSLPTPPTSSNASNSLEAGSFKSEKTHSTKKRGLSDLSVEKHCSGSDKKRGSSPVVEIYYTPAKSPLATKTPGRIECADKSTKKKVGRSSSAKETESASLPLTAYTSFSSVMSTVRSAIESSTSCSKPIESSSSPIKDTSTEPRRKERRMKEVYAGLRTSPRFKDSSTSAYTSKPSDTKHNQHRSSKETILSIPPSYSKHRIRSQLPNKQNRTPTGQRHERKQQINATVQHLCTCQLIQTLSLTHSSIYLSQTLSPNRRRQLLALLARKHANTSVVSRVGYWARGGLDGIRGDARHAENAGDDDDYEEGGSNAGGSIDKDEHIDELSGNIDDDDDSLVLESQAYPGLTKVLLVDAMSWKIPLTSRTKAIIGVNCSATSGTAMKASKLTTAAPAARAMQELVDARIRDNVYFWDWRVLRALSGLACSKQRMVAGCESVSNTGNHSKHSIASDMGDIRMYYVGQARWERSRKGDSPNGGKFKYRYHACFRRQICG